MSQSELTSVTGSRGVVIRSMDKRCIIKTSDLILDYSRQILLNDVPEGKSEEAGRLLDAALKRLQQLQLAIKVVKALIYSGCIRSRKKNVPCINVALHTAVRFSHHACACIQTQQGDLAGLRVSEALRAVADLELLQAPGLAFSIPKDYASRPR